VLEKKDRDRQQMVPLFKDLYSNKVVTSDQFAKGFSKVIELVPDLIVDMPLSWKHVAVFIGNAIADGYLPLSFLDTSLDGLVNVGLGVGVAAPTAVEIIKIVGGNRSDLSEKDLQKLLPRFFRPEHRNDTFISAFIKEKGLSDLFPAMLIQGQIEAKLKNKDSVDSILKWVDESATSPLPSGPTFARWLIRTVLNLGKAGGADEESKVLEKYGKLLQRFLKDSIPIQVACLFEIQLFWHGLGMPKGFMEPLFVALYDGDVFLEEAFKQWRDDEDDGTPGKTDALIQTRKWLEWLENAEEESDEEEK